MNHSIIPPAAAVIDSYNSITVSMEGKKLKQKKKKKKTHAKNNRFENPQLERGANGSCLVLLLLMNVNSGLIYAGYIRPTPAPEQNRPQSTRTDRQIRQEKACSLYKTKQQPLLPLQHLFGRFTSR